MVTKSKTKGVWTKVQNILFSFCCPADIPNNISVNIELPVE